MFYSLSRDIEYKASSNTLVDLPVRRSHRLHGLPPDFPPTMEGNEGETMEQPATSNYHVEGVPVNEMREEFSSYDNPLLVQQPSTEDISFLFPTEGQPGSSNWVFNHPSHDTVATYFGSNDLFWETPLGKSISEYGTTRPSYVTPI